MADQRRTRVYLSGPYSKGDRLANTLRMCDVWDQLLTAGYLPMNPLWSHWQDQHKPRPYEDWLSFDLEWIAVCDVLLRLPGESSGADREVAGAHRLGISVFRNMAELLRETAPTVTDGFAKADAELCVAKREIGRLARIPDDLFRAEYEAAGLPTGPAGIIAHLQRQISDYIAAVARLQQHNAALCSIAEECRTILDEANPCDGDAGGYWLDHTTEYMQETIEAIDAALEMGETKKE